MVINGIDYTLPFLALVSFLLLFACQLLLLRLPGLRFLRHLPWVWVIGMLALAVFILFSKPTGFLDLRGAFALIFVGYAAICAAGIGAAYLVHKFLKR